MFGANHSPLLMSMRIGYWGLLVSLNHFPWCQPCPFLMGLRKVIWDHLESLTQLLCANPSSLLLGMQKVFQSIWSHWPYFVVATLPLTNENENINLAPFRVIDRNLGCLPFPLIGTRKLILDHLSYWPKFAVPTLHPCNRTRDRSFGILWNYSPEFGVGVIDLHLECQSSHLLMGMAITFGTILESFTIIMGYQSFVLANRHAKSFRTICSHWPVSQIATLLPC